MLPPRELDDDEEKEVLEWMYAKFQNNLHCPLCGSDDIDPHPRILRVLVASVGTEWEPFIVLVCLNCNYQMLFNFAHIALGGWREADDLDGPTGDGSPDDDA